MVIPNSKMANQTIVNMSAVDPATVVNVPISVGYSSDIPQARQILTDLAERHENAVEVLSCPVTELGDSGVTICLRARCPDESLTYGVEFDLYEQAKERFAHDGIEIPHRYTNVILSDERKTATR